MIRKYGWRPDVVSWNDPHYRLQAPTKVTHVDRIGMNVPIDDQGELGSCTGNATTAAIEIVTGCDPLSRLMAYFNGRVPEATQDVDAGAMISDVIAGVQTYGIAREELWPYEIRRFAERPPLDAYVDGRNLFPLVGQPQRVITLASLKHALVSGIPVVFGFSVPEYFESLTIARAGWLPMPDSRESMLGGHCVVAVGFDDRPAKPFVWCRNSWGRDWGIDGYFQMDQRWFIDHRRLCDDMWAIPKAA